MGKPYAWQLNAKVEYVRRLFQQAGMSALQRGMAAEIVPSPKPAGYRNRIKLVPARGQGDGPVSLGLYQADSHEVTDIPGCPVQDPRLNDVIEILREAVIASGITLYDEATHSGDLRFVTARLGAVTGEVLIGLVTRGAETPVVRSIADQIFEAGQGVVGVALNVNPEPGNVIFGPDTFTLAGRPWFEERICGRTLRLGVASFFQVNTGVAELAYQAIVGGMGLSASSTLIDLYCGVGAIGMMAADQAGDVIGIEEVSEAIQFGRQAAKANGIRNMTFRRGLVERELPGLASRLMRTGMRGDRLCVAVNPPRRGLDRSVVDLLIQVGAGRMAYLSCEPLTLVRDLKQLCRGDYRVTSVVCFDMFPQTRNVETLVLLESDEGGGYETVRRRGR